MIRRFREQDAIEVSQLIGRALRETNIRDYSESYIEDEVRRENPQHLIQHAQETHFYVVLEGKTIVGCGAIGLCQGKEDESYFSTIFVLPEYQGRGIGKKIISVLESDEWYLQSRRVQIDASITACEFYRRLGYTYEKGIKVLNEDQLYMMEKLIDRRKHEKGPV